jgi:voltage-gated potassium channel
MIMPLLLALVLTCVTVIIHAIGTLEAIAYLSRVWQRKKGDQGSFVSVLQILRVVTVLLLLHWVEAGIWAGFFLASGALPDLETAVYFSFTSYTTLGYGDVVLPKSWRLLGPFEGAVGILMFGWSTGIIVAAITRIYGSRLRLLSE